MRNSGACGHESRKTCNKSLMPEMHTRLSFTMHAARPPGDTGSFAAGFRFTQYGLRRENLKMNPICSWIISQETKKNKTVWTEEVNKNLIGNRFSKISQSFAYFLTQSSSFRSFGKNQNFHFMTCNECNRESEKKITAEVVPLLFTLFLSQIALTLSPVWPRKFWICVRFAVLPILYLTQNLF